MQKLYEDGASSLRSSLGSKKLKVAIASEWNFFQDRVINSCSSFHRSKISTADPCLAISVMLWYRQQVPWMIGSGRIFLVFTTLRASWCIVHPGMKITITKYASWYKCCFMATTYHLYRAIELQLSAMDQAVSRLYLVFCLMCHISITTCAAAPGSLLHLRGSISKDVTQVWKTVGILYAPTEAHSSHIIDLQLLLPKRTLKPLRKTTSPIRNSAKVFPSPNTLDV